MGRFNASAVSGAFLPFALFLLISFVPCFIHLFLLCVHWVSVHVFKIRYTLPDMVHSCVIVVKRLASLLLLLSMFVSGSFVLGLGFF